MYASIVHFASKTELFTLHDWDSIPEKDEIIGIYHEEEGVEQKRYRVVRVIHICAPVYSDSSNLQQLSLELEVVECT